jgi:hypothetical protein
MSRSAKRVSLVLGLATVLLAAQAEARTEQLRFTHPDASSVGTFRVYVGSVAGQSDLLAETVTPSGPDPSGVYTYVIEVESEATLYIRMTAVDTAAQESIDSNEIERNVPLGLPGQPIVVLP